MRFYNLTLKNPKTGAIIKQWTSMAGGYTDPGAHQIEFDVYTAPFSLPLSDVSSSIKIRGPALQDLGASNFAGATVDLYVGMAQGLPLANPAQQGAILKNCTVFAAFGNWIGTDMTIDFLVTPNMNTIANPANLVLDWKAGMPLSQALSATLGAAYPGVPQEITISPLLVLAHDEVGVYPTLQQLADIIEGITYRMIGANYTGVQILFANGVLHVFDSTVIQTPTQIAFTDLVGQPTWIEPQIVQITTVMRGDIRTGTLIQLPQGKWGLPGSTFTVPSTPAAYRQSSIFQQPLFIKRSRHVGSFRDPAGTSWVSIFDCVPGAPVPSVGSTS